MLFVAETPGEIPTIRKPRWHDPTPAKFLFAVLLMQGVLFLSARYHWFWFNELKGYTVLITVAATAAALLLLAILVIVSRFFRAKSQFGLATLLLMVPLMALPCGWLAKELQQAERLDALINAVEPSQGGFGFAPEYHDRVLVRWLEPTLGKRFFREVTVLELRERNVAALQEMRHFTKLDVFRLTNGAFTDADLAYLDNCSQLTHVDLDKMAFGDAGIKHLSGLRNLRGLQIKETGVTDAGLNHLAGLTQLTTLELDNTPIGDAGLLHVGRLSQMFHLSLNGTQITDEGLFHLKDLTNLHDLCLSRTQITDAGLSELANLTNLKVLYLSDTDISDAGLDHLKELKGLNYLILERTKVSAEGVEAIQKLLPQCKIFR
jgi:hypothetical protein